MRRKGKMNYYETENNKMATVSPYLSIITLNINKVWGGRREEGSGWGTRVHLWQIHFDI